MVDCLYHKNICLCCIDRERDGDLKTAVLGYGTVGGGVYDFLQTTEGLAPGGVLVRPGKVRESFMTDSLDALLADPQLEAVAEAIGGVEPACTYAKKVLASGRHFVTANKALVACRGIELAALAREKGAAFLFSAACGGGVPFLSNLRAARKSDTILSVSGILNGTTNYMLDAMQRSNRDYAGALAEAQRLGYAESDPSADVSGLDALRKIALACALAFSRLPGEDGECEGIESLRSDDVRDFASRGLVCRLLASGGCVSERVYAYVEPVLFPASSLEGAVLENGNLARYVGKNSGSIVLQGQGAGRGPTASAVLRDLTAIQSGAREMLPADCVRVRADNALPRHPYYVRLPLSSAAALPWRETAQKDGIVRGITENLSVAEMHAFAKSLRKDGGEVFFAALGE